MKKWYPGQDTPEITERETNLRRLSARAAAEGMVLLENSGILPLRPGMKLALFGRGSRYTIKGGTGSGDVNSRNTVTVDAGLRAAGFQVVNTAYLDQYDRAYAESVEDWKERIYRELGGERDPRKLYHAHATLTPALPDLPIPPEAVREAEAVVYVITRVSGEFADRRAEKGDYYLSDREEEELRILGGFGLQVVVLLNVGGIMDLSFVDTCRVDALLLMSQAGSESGTAVADILSGRVNPSGRLTDTYALRYEDYPSSATFSHRNGNLTEEFYTEGIYVGYRYFDSFGVRPRYPFGYGLSYTSFSGEVCSAALRGTRLEVGVKVRNTGACAGKHVVQLYAACPSGELATEQKRLVAFGKTGLLAPAGEETLHLAFDLRQLASYHEGRSAWILQAGAYGVFAGENAGALTPAVCLRLDQTVDLEQLTPICEMKEALAEIVPVHPDLDLKEYAFPLEEIRITSAALEARSVPAAAVPGYAPDPATEKQARDIAAKMTLRDKACLVVGARSAMAGEIVGSQATRVPGAAGETVAFSQHGIPGMILADGPAGLRINPEYEVDPVSGDILQPRDWFEMLEIRFFKKKVRHEGAQLRYQYATAIPIGTLLAQSFDVALVEEVGAAVAEELRAFHIAVWLAPGMNIHRNPLCGRNFEYYSEDPLLSGLMAAAMTRGVQRKPGVGVSIKHFACNNQEDNRMHVNEMISERALREIYLKGFETAVKTAGPMTIMTSYNRINGVHSANSADLCTTVARKEWGFRGYIMTDWSTTNGGGSSAAKCIAAGNDLVMPGKDSDIQEIIDAVERRRLPHLTEEKLNENVVRLICAALICDRALS